MRDMEAHYNEVSRAWQYAMGRYQHYGLYKTGQENLNQASENLIDAMLAFHKGNAHLQILDVGCGTGGSAIYLNRKLHANVTGIALTETEIKQAKANNTRLGNSDRINFIQADGQDNQLDSQSFDLVVMMESALLVPDKLQLFAENHRVLKEGGSFILCDQIKIKPMRPSEIYQHGAALESLEITFGHTQTVTLQDYQQFMQEVGFIKIKVLDITPQVMKSPIAWKNNAILHKTDMLKHMSKIKFEHFILACDALEEFMKNEFLGYGIVKGQKAF